MRVASEATGSGIKGREREKCLLQVCLPPCWLVLVKIAGRASGPGGDIKTVDVVKPLRPPSSLSCVSCDGRLIVGGVALGFGGAELSSVGNCSPTGVFGTSLLGSAFLAVIVSWLSTSGILCVDSTGPVVLWSSSSSCCWRCSALLLWCGRLRATQVSPVVVGAGLHAGQVLFPSAWCVLRHHRFVAVFVRSLEWQCCVAWNIRVAWSLVGDLAGVDIRRHLSSSEHFSYRSSSCLFSLVVVALFSVVLSVFCFRSCPFARLFLPVLVRSFLGWIVALSLPIVL